MPTFSDYSNPHDTRFDDCLGTIQQTERVAEIFRQVTFLAPMTASQRLELAQKSTVRHFVPQTNIVIEGEIGDTFYIIVEGEVTVFKMLGDVMFKLATRGVGTFFGEMALLQDEARSATVQATTTVEAIELDRAGFKELLLAHPEIMFTVLHEISQRLRYTDQQMIHHLVEKNEELKRAYYDIESSYDATLVALSKALDLRDTLTEGHSIRVAKISRLIGKALGLSDSQLNSLHRGALLHDVGKIGVPDGILNKQGKLGPEEWQVMRQHPTWGAKVLEHIPFLEDALPIVSHHHEAWDGSGYPNGLVGTEIPLLSRIFSVADTYDAITCERPYKPPFPPEQALAIITREAGRQFDPEVVAAFVRVFSQVSEILTDHDLS